MYIDFTNATILRWKHLLNEWYKIFDLQAVVRLAMAAFTGDLLLLALLNWSNCESCI